MKITKLAIVDDHHLFRKGLISLINDYKDLSVSIEASNGIELKEALRRNTPDIILLDVEMPEMDGIEVTEYLALKYPSVKILILTMHNEEEIIFDLIDKGAHGVLLKDDSIDQVIDAIYAVKDTGYYFKENISKVMISNLVRTKKIIPRIGKVRLTEREIEVVRLICNELTNKEIADKLCISARTVDGHRLNILKKLGARNSIGIVMYAVKHRLLD
ncbi:MAG: response regulator [Bacteroidia bacterium]